MKIIIIQEAGRHPENSHFREALSWQRAFRAHGHEAVVWGLGFKNFVVPFEKASKDADVIFLLEQYDQTGWTPDFSKSKALKIDLSIDDHVNIQEHLRQVKRQKIDIHFCATRLYLNYYRRPRMKKFWLPNCYDDSLFFPTNTPKTIALGFVGNVCNRRRWIKVLQNDMNLHFREMLLGHEMVNFINSSRIHWNRNIDSDVNYRHFETLGCKTFLLTNRAPDTDLLFEIGKEIVVYRTMKDLQEKIKYYRRHSGEREAIADAGYRRVKRDHTYTTRCKQLLEYIQ